LIIYLIFITGRDLLTGGYREVLSSPLAEAGSLAEDLVLLRQVRHYLKEVAIEGQLCVPQLNTVQWFRVMMHGKTKYISKLNRRGYFHLIDVYFV
jgi:hypothetical protein